MREIKFRAWDKENSRWRYGYITKLVEGIRKFWAIIEEDKDEGLVRYFTNYEKTISQYTGLKDKNGKEIYDLDFFSDGIELYISWCDKCRGWQLFHDGDDCFSCSGDIHLKDCEEIELNVVGNILENPELIKREELSGN